MKNKINPETAKKEQLELVDLQLSIAQLSVTIKNLTRTSVFTDKQIAERLDCSIDDINNFLKDPRKIPIETLTRFVWACGYKLEVLIK